MGVMIKCKCYENQIGENFDECVASALQEVRRPRCKEIILLFDGIPLRINRNTTYKDVIYRYMIASSKL